MMDIKCLLTLLAGCLLVGCSDSAKQDVAETRPMSVVHVADDAVFPFVSIFLITLHGLPTATQ